MKNLIGAGLSPEASARRIVDRLRRLVAEIRHGRRETTLVLVALGCFAVPSLTGYLPLPQSILNDYYFVRSFYAAGGLLLVWAFVRILRQATPAPLVSTAPKPAAIKGPMAFGQADGELFSHLKRDAEIGKLLDCVLDDQEGLIVVMGESGAGKTSLLRAGLSHALDAQEVPQGYFYWEAVPNNAPHQLLSSINGRLEAGKSLSAFTDLASVGDVAGPCTIVLDQFEQLDFENAEHRPIFDLIHQVATETPPPHRCTWVVAFRSEYSAKWRGFEIDHDFTARALQVKTFGPAQASQVMATLAAEAEFTMEQDLVDDMVRAATRKERVSPVDIGIGMLVLQDLATRRDLKHLALKDYRFAGGAQGLFTEYLRDNLDSVPEVEREGVLKAFLALADLETNQRIATGRTLTELATEAGLPERLLSGHFAYLSSPDVRLVERLGEPEQNKYRLPHERLIPALRTLTGQLLAAVDLAQQILDRAFRAWNGNEQKPRYLLAGGELRQVITHRANLRYGDNRDALQGFIKQSIKRRNVRWTACACGALMLAVAGYFGQERYREDQHRNYLAAISLPRDLFDNQTHLKSLTIIRPITSLNWLRADLESLTVRSSFLASLASLPELARLQTLNLSGSQVSSLEGLPELASLQTLALRGSQVSSLKGLPELPALTAMMFEGYKLKSLEGLPPSVVELTFN